MIVIAPTTTLRVTTAHGLELGEFVVEEQRGELVLGTFVAGVDYPSVEPLFRHFEELVEGQVLSLVDAAADAIAQLRIRVVKPDTSEPILVTDVQFYSDGPASFRFPAGVGSNRNGVQS